MKLKKLLSIGLITVLTGSMLVGCSNSKDSKDLKDSNPVKEDKIKITMITDVGGVNDKSFNKNALEGLEKAKKDLGVDVKCIESKQEADYANNIKTAVEDGSNLVIGIGVNIEKAIDEAAKSYPDQKFTLIDSDLKGELPKNVESITFKTEESSYLVGLVAGRLTETDKVGFIGGVENPMIENFQAGFISGVKAVNPEIEIVSKYANSFNDSEKGKSIANEMISDGVDIIFHASGDTGNGVIEAAKESGKKVIGVDTDQNSIAPETIITSAVKNIDIGVYDAIKNLVDGNFSGGKVIIYGLNEGGVGVADTTKEDVSPDVLEFVNQKGDKIKSGEIKVPNTIKEVE